MRERGSVSGYEGSKEPDGFSRTPSVSISPDGRPESSRRYCIPARRGQAIFLEPRQHLKIINTYGTQVCDLWAFHASSPQEILSMEHSRAWLSRITPKPGDPLVTNQRRPILTLLEDTSPGIHDTLIAACDIYRYRSLGIAEHHDNCANNLKRALEAIKFHTEKVPAPLNLWMNISIKSDGTLAWLSPVSKPNDYVVFRAEIACVVVMSACPQDVIPINGEHCTPTDLHFEVF